MGTEGYYTASPSQGKKKLSVDGQVYHFNYGVFVQQKLTATLLLIMKVKILSSKDLQAITPLNHIHGKGIYR